MDKHIVIVGSGIAGLSLAYKLSQKQANLPITLVTKSELSDSNTRYAQGGIAAVIDQQNDSFEKHIQDTLVCGKGLCDPSVVEMVVRQAPARISDLIEWGARFDRENGNAFNVALEGGHTHPRVLHHKDMTGFEIETVLIAQIKKCDNITVLEHHSALDLITENSQRVNSCIGITVCDWKNKKLKKIAASQLVLASGGCGQVYLNTTNPLVATGDGYAIAARAGATLRDMRFMQFHPTALYSEKKESVSFLISEALRGFGAHIIDKKGKRFLFTYDVRGELATRDCVSSAIMDHLNKSGEKFVYMDLRHLDNLELEKHFPTIKTELHLRGFDPSNDLIPVTPSAHYQCGGIKVNQSGETNLTNLYAIGEVASTGLHGSNRLASNSLLEALVYAHNASDDIILKSNRVLNSKLLVEETDLADCYTIPDLSAYFQSIKSKMSSSAFSNQKESIQNKINVMTEIESKMGEFIQNKFYTIDFLNLRNIACTAQYILKDKLNSLNNLTTRKVK